MLRATLAKRLYILLLTPQYTPTLSQHHHTTHYLVDAGSVSSDVTNQQHHPHDTPSHDIVDAGIVSSDDTISRHPPHDTPSSRYRRCWLSLLRRYDSTRSSSPYAFSQHRRCWHSLLGRPDFPTLLSRSHDSSHQRLHDTFAYDPRYPSRYPIRFSFSVYLVAYTPTVVTILVPCFSLAIPVSIVSGFHMGESACLRLHLGHCGLFAGSHTHHIRTLPSHRFVSITGVCLNSLSEDTLFCFLYSGLLRQYASDYHTTELIKSLKTPTSCNLLIIRFTAIAFFALPMPP